MMNNIELFGEFAKDSWDLGKVKDEKIANMFKYATEKNRILDFTKVKSPSEKKNLKKFLFYKLSQGGLSSDTYKHHYFNSLKKVTEFLSENDILDEILKNQNIDNDDKNFIKQYNEYKGRFININPEKMDIWYLEDFKLAEKRINKVSKINTLSFCKVKNESNKKVVKKYFKWKIESTQLSVSYIKKELSNVIEFENLINKDFSQLNRKDIENYLYSIKEQKKDLRSSKIGKIKKLMEFLVSEEVTKEIFFVNQDYAKSEKNLKIRVVEEEVVNKIYEKMDNLDVQIARMFLVLNNCGLRISEVCLLELDSMQKTNSGTYLKIYQQKMSKFVTNPIPEELYNVLEKQREEVVKNFSKENKYLFSIKKSQPIKREYFTKQMKKFCAEQNIRKTNGEIYDFKCHDFRHTFATKLLEKDVPYHIIQRLLGHKSIEMTMSYTEIDDKRRKEKYKKFINTQGKIRSLNGDHEVTDEEFELQWLKKNINYQTLPNGMCALPIGLGTCPHSNSCLTCEKYFRTSKEYLPVLEKQLEKTKEVIKISEKNGWIRQVKNNREIEENLKKIIENLGD